MHDRLTRAVRFVRLFCRLWADWLLHRRWATVSAPAGICARCGRCYRPGSRPASHGLCAEHRHAFDVEVASYGLGVRS